jgi:hypothetical protein
MLPQVRNSLVGSACGQQPVTSPTDELLAGAPDDPGDTPPPAAEELDEDDGDGITMGGGGPGEIGATDTDDEDLDEDRLDDEADDSRPTDGPADASDDGSEMGGFPEGLLLLEGLGVTDVGDTGGGGPGGNGTGDELTDDDGSVAQQASPTARSGRPL